MIDDNDFVEELFELIDLCLVVCMHHFSRIMYLVFFGNPSCCQEK